MRLNTLIEIGILNSLIDIVPSVVEKMRVGTCGRQNGETLKNKGEMRKWDGDFCRANNNKAERCGRAGGKRTIKDKVIW